MQFQSTLPRRERRYKRRYRCGFIYFNPRSHEGSDAFSIVSVSSFALFQSTLPRRERLSYLGALASGFMISIHAPTKGATNKYCFYSTFNKFQSTLPRRERRRGCIRSGAHTNFNPRSHEGSDSKNFPGTGSCRNFNPRSHEGSDCILSIFRLQFKKFQSTLPRRERPDDQKSLVRTYTNFNPRSHKGSDHGIMVALVFFCNISIHAPTKGATVTVCAPESWRIVFQSTLPQRERLTRSLCFRFAI